jgi:two-component system, cell cycle sensor histidine kinase and response regulator CckA
MVLARRAATPAVVLDAQGLVIACSHAFAELLPAGTDPEGRSLIALLGAGREESEGGHAVTAVLRGEPRPGTLAMSSGHRLVGALMPVFDGSDVVGAFGTWQLEPPAPARRTASTGFAGDLPAFPPALRGEGERLAETGSWERRLPDGVARWSLEAFRIFGMEPVPTVSPEEFLERVHPDDREQLIAARATLHASDAPIDDEFRIVRPDGEVRTLHARTMIERDDAGVPRRLFGFVQDVTEHRRALEALQRSERRLSLVFQGATDLMFLCRVEANELRYEAVNSALLQRLGITEPQVIGRRPEDVLPPQNMANLRKWIAAALRDGKPQHYQSTISLATGVLEAETTLSPLFDDDGTITHLFGIARDVSAWRRAERAAATAERQFRDVVEHSLTGICIIQRGRFSYVNPRFAELLGRTSAELLALDSIMEVVAPESRDLVQAQVQRRERGEATRLHYEFTGIRPDGSRVDVEWYGTESEYEGAPATIGTMLDITERAEAVRALRASEVRFRIVAAVSQSMIFEYDPVTHTTYRSEAIHSVFGYPLEEADATADWWRDRVHPDDRESYDATVATGPAGSRGWGQEYRFRRHDGSYATVHERVVIVRDDEGNIVRFIGGITDTSERRELLQQLVQSQKMEAVGQLAGGIAHDFNNLLTVVKCHSELLLDELRTDHALRDDVVQIHQASVRAAALTRQLLAFSRKQLLLPRQVDLNEVIRGLEPMLRRLLGEDIAIRTDLTAGLGTTMADAGQVEQVLVNFAVNARDAMPGGGTLAIRSFVARLDEEFCRRNAGARPGTYCAVEVRDTGTGMDERTVARVFEPFFTTKDVGKGTGLGLSTVYGIIKQSGGYVTAESTPGAGSTFTFYLPRRDDDAAGSEQEPEKFPLPRGRESILLVEDEPSVRALARRMLERHGYTVVEAEDGASALEIARERDGTLDLVVTDLVMPRLSGRELAERLRAEHPGLRYLFMSGYTDDDIVRRGLSRPGMAFLSKPFTMAELLQAVRKVLDGE